MRWIKASERTPDFTHAHLVHLRFSTNETKFSLTGYYKDGLWYRQYGDDNLLDWAPNLEWLDEAPPASAVEEAARMYPYDSDDSTERLCNAAARSAHITCARMYTGEIDKYRKALEEIREIKSIDYACYQKTQNIIRTALNIK